ncbi:MAG: hypothetical protein HY897_20740 [Deltaproteobacteria bacterium]|nr:hypothetical protein [Deltaproteobacteria bacterium]
MRQFHSLFTCIILIAVAAAGALGLAACSSDFAVPAEAQLGCAAAADCPSGWTCNAKVGRCVKTENIDSEAPAQRSFHGRRRTHR